MWMEFLSQYGAYRADRAQAKAQKAIQAYRNKMLNISNAMNQNSITTNQTLAIQQSAKQAVFQRRDELSTLGATAVSAASAGVRGNSVNMSLLDVQRNAGFQEKARQTDLEQQFMQFRQERLTSNLSAVMGMDYSYIPKPALGSYMLKAAMDVSNKAMMMGAG